VIRRVLALAVSAFLPSAVAAQVDDAT
jgi:hypothetical protein